MNHRFSLNFRSTVWNYLPVLKLFTFSYLLLWLCCNNFIGVKYHSNVHLVSLFIPESFAISFLVMSNYLTNFHSFDRRISQKRGEIEESMPDLMFHLQLPTWNPKMLIKWNSQIRTQIKKRYVFWDQYTAMRITRCQLSRAQAYAKVKIVGI